MIRGYQNEINKIYEQMRKNQANEIKKRRKEIENVIPEVIKIEQKIGKLCIEVSISAFKNKDKTENHFKTLKEQITDLRVKKSELLVSHGYSMDYLNIPYNCTKCKDTGFIGNKKCSCYYKKLVTLYYDDSELKELLIENNFNNFKIDYYSTHRTEDSMESPKHNMEKILNKAHSFINDFKHSNENLLFYGSSGTGKTFMTHCIAKELLDKGNLVIYKTAEELIKDLKEILFTKSPNLEDLIINCDLLIIDDLGTEQINDFSRTEFFNLLNKKLNKKKKMIISTNFSLESLLKSYSERTTSRLLGNFTISKFYGDDIRIKNNLKKIYK